MAERSGSTTAFATAALEREITAAQVSELDEGVIYWLAPQVSAASVLRSAWDSSEIPAQDDQFEGAADQSWIDALCDTLGVAPHPLVACWNPSSIVSGVWGLGTFEFGGRGYLYSFPEDTYGVFEDGFPLYAAWEPVTSEAMARLSFIMVYRKVWDEIGLPPWFGEVANGPLGWMTDAILGFDGPLSVYSAAPSDHLLESIVEAGAPETVAEELKVPGEIVDRLLRELQEHGLPDEGTLTGDRGRAFLALSLRAVRNPLLPT